MKQSNRIIETLRSHRLVDGLTHNLYSYPARFSPDLTKEVISAFSNPGDWIFDPFMGGGTSVVQAVSMGRNILGVDINSLAYFVAENKITNLSSSELKEVRNWIVKLQEKSVRQAPNILPEEIVQQFPSRFTSTLNAYLAAARKISSRKARKFAKFILLTSFHGLLKEGEFPSVSLIRTRILKEFLKATAGLDRFRQEAIHSRKTTGIFPSARLLNRSIIGLEKDKRVQAILGQPKLVFTSPPYPGVHVLYNKWQIFSRKETNLPYFISDTKDSLPASHYTMGSRSKSGIDEYFALVEQAYSSIVKIVHKEALIIQVVGFSDTKTQLPRYLNAMKNSGLKEVYPITLPWIRAWREVPNRKWYSNGKSWDASREVLLFHRLK